MYYVQQWMWKKNRQACSSNPVMFNLSGRWPCVWQIEKLSKHRARSFRTYSRQRDSVFWCKSLGIYTMYSRKSIQNNSNTVQSFSLRGERAQISLRFLWHIFLLFIFFFEARVVSISKKRFRIYSEFPNWLALISLPFWFGLVIFFAARDLH